jgi:NADPH:quinone reductase
MQAVMIDRLGGPEVLQVRNREAPEPGAGQLLVQVAAAGVNFMDIYQREGRAYKLDLPSGLGVEGAGRVSRVGPDVTGFKPGDRVAWQGAQGSYAELVIVPAARAVPVPDGIELEIAAAAMLQGMTAHYLTHSTFPVTSNQLVVVHAAAGGVGLLLTQIVKMRGGVVLATTSTAEKARLATGAGADRVADYEDFVAAAKEMGDKAGAHVVYDGVGKATFERSLTALRRRGYGVLYGAASGPVPPFDLQRLNPLGSLFVTRPTLGDYVATRDELLERSGAIFRWIKEGTLKVRVGASYPLEQAARAHQDLAARRTTGKLLLIPHGSG